MYARRTPPARRTIGLDCRFRVNTQSLRMLRPTQMPTASHHERLLYLIGEVIGLLELDEFRPGLIRALRAAVPADWIALNDLGPTPSRRSC